MTNALDSVFGRLSAAGVPRAYVRSKVLPSWWDEELAESPNGFTETLVMMASRLGVTPSELRGDRPLDLAPQGACRFKLSSATHRNDVVVAQRIALQTARVVAQAVTTPVRGVPPATALRDELLSAGARWIDFDALLGFCWRAGIVVLHVSELPQGKKMTALAAYVGQRPVIVLCQKHRHPSWLSFHLAHELGHLALGHVDPGGMLADEGIDVDSTDADERDANGYAFQLLGGAPPARLPRTVGFDASVLAARAVRLGEERRVDPGHLVLAYGRQVDRLSLAAAALNVLGAPEEAAPMVHRHLRAAVDFDAVAEDQLEFAARVMGVALDP